VLQLLLVKEHRRPPVVVPDAVRSAQGRLACDPAFTPR